MALGHQLHIGRSRPKPRRRFLWRGCFFEFTTAPFHQLTIYSQGQRVEAVSNDLLEVVEEEQRTCTIGKLGGAKDLNTGVMFAIESSDGTGAA